MFLATAQRITHFQVWHNYSFDRAILTNHGIVCDGFGGDTMHMARLWDAGRNQMGGYSLEGLSAGPSGWRVTPLCDL